MENMELDFISPIKNTVKSTCNAFSSLCNSASDGLGKMAQNASGNSVFYGGFNAPYWGFGFPFGPWGWGCCIPYNNPLVFRPWHSPFLGVYTDPVPSFLSFGGNAQPQLPQPTTSTLPSALSVPASSTDIVSSLFGNTGTSIYSIQENPFAVPIFGATPDALALMGYNVPQYQQQQPTAVQQQAGVQMPASVAAYSPTASPAVTQIASPITAPVAGAVTPDFYFHPEHYASQSPAPSQRTEENATPKQEEQLQVTSDNATELAEELPTYYTELANKKSKGQRLTAQEEDLYNKYQKIINEYSPFEKDKDGRILKDANNNYIRSKLYDKIEELHGCLDSHDNVAAEKIIRNCSPEELAAIEFYWRSVSGSTDENGNTTQLNNKPFRTMLKDSFMSRFTSGWLNSNDSNCEKLFDYIDSKVADLSPRSIALSFYQYTNNCHQWGTGIDRERVINLLNKIKGNKPLIEAVKQEYRNYCKQYTGTDDTLHSAITGKAFVWKNSDTYKLADDVLL